MLLVQIFGFIGRYPFFQPALRGTETTEIHIGTPDLCLRASPSPVCVVTELSCATVNFYYYYCQSDVVPNFESGTGTRMTSPAATAIRNELYVEIKIAIICGAHLL